MGVKRIEAKLRKTSQRLQRARQDLAVLDEQYDTFADDEADAALRAMMSDSVDAPAHARDAQGHAAAMRRQRAHLQQLIGELAAEQDELLDRLNDARR